MRQDQTVRVALTFDFDGLASYIAMGASSPSSISRGEFSPTGVRRILAILDQAATPATFFVPGHTALLFPHVVNNIVTAGHEIAHHGFVHEDPVGLDAEAERRLLERGIEALVATTGERPVGYRSPSWATSSATIGLLHELNFEYDSSLMGSDFEPYWCRVNDVISATEAYQVGQAVPVVELPVAWHLDDVPYFERHFTTQLITEGLRSPREVGQIWRAEFDYLVDNVGSGLFTLTMHPEVIGRGHRIGLLSEFVSHAAERGAEFVSCRVAAADWRRGREPAISPDLARALKEDDGNAAQPG